MILRRLIPLPPEEKEPSKTELIWMAASYIGSIDVVITRRRTQDSDTKRAEE